MHKVELKYINVHGEKYIGATEPDFKEFTAKCFLSGLGIGCALGLIGVIIACLVGCSAKGIAPAGANENSVYAKCTEYRIAQEPTEERSVVVTIEPTVAPAENTSTEPTVEPTEKTTAEPTAKPTEEPTAEPTTEPTAEPWMTFTATAYCGCTKCCGIWGENRPVDETGKTIVLGRSGRELVEMYSIAVDPDVIPLGSLVEAKLSSGKTVMFRADDIGGAINNNKIDVYFESHQDALNWGVQTVQLRIVWRAE